MRRCGEPVGVGEQLVILEVLMSLFCGGACGVGEPVMWGSSE